MIKKISLILVLMLSLLLVAILLFINSGMDLPPETEAVIEEVVAKGGPELVQGETGRAHSGELEIWYESISPPGEKTKGTILLIMGAAQDALAWPDYLYRPLVEAGYRVIRYDHRGVGMSDWVKGWDRKNPYHLEDMAADALAVLDAAGVTQAHVVGFAMGGMIGQRLAISHGERLLSLTSIASSGYSDDPELAAGPGRVQQEMLKLFLKYGLMQREADTIKLMVGIAQLFKGDGDYSLDVRRIADYCVYQTRIRRGFNPQAWDQHLFAVSASGSRYSSLGETNVPTLVIHGQSDPLLPPAHGQKYAALIPGARTLWVEGMGHDIPRAYAPLLVPALLSHFRLAVPDR